MADIGSELLENMDPEMVAVIMNEIELKPSNIDKSAVGSPEPMEEWEKPIPLRQVPCPPVFPCDALPGWMGDYVEAESEATQTPSGLAGSLILATAAAALSKKIEVMGRPGWFESVNTYIAVALPPGSRKSQVMNDITKPLADYERNEAESMRPRIRPCHGRG